VKITGKIVEVGMTRDGNEVEIEISKDYHIILQRFSNAMTKEVATHLFQYVTITLEFSEVTVEGEKA
jgi:hypothetical protein